MSALGQSRHVERTSRCPLCLQKRTCAVQPVMSAKGHKRTSLWQQLVRKALHAAWHRCLDGGEIAPGRAWLGGDHLDPNNEDGRDHDKGNGQRLAHVQPLSSLVRIASTQRAGAM
jgi:hypothetical protein